MFSLRNKKKNILTYPLELSVTVMSLSERQIRSNRDNLEIIFSMFLYKNVFLYKNINCDPSLEPSR